MEYDIIYKYKDNKYLAMKDNKYGIIDVNNNVVVPFDYDTLDNPHDDSINYLIAKKDNKYGVINDSNEIIIPFNYDTLLFEFNHNSESKNTAFIGFAFEKDNKYGIIDKSGKEIIKPEYGLAIILNNEEISLFLFSI
jgi:hypothetical protein